MANRKLARRIRNTMEAVEDYLPLLEIALTTLAAKDTRNRKYYQMAQVATVVAKRAAEKAAAAVDNDDQVLQINQAQNTENLGKHLDGLLDALMQY